MRTLTRTRVSINDRHCDRGECLFTRQPGFILAISKRLRGYNDRFKGEEVFTVTEVYPHLLIGKHRHGYKEAFAKKDCMSGQIICREMDKAASNGSETIKS